MVCIAGYHDTIQTLLSPSRPLRRLVCRHQHSILFESYLQLGQQGPVLYRLQRELVQQNGLIGIENHLHWVEDEPRLFLREVPPILPL